MVCEDLTKIPRNRFHNSHACFPWNPSPSALWPDWYPGTVAVLVANYGCSVGCTSGCRPGNTGEWASHHLPLRNAIWLLTARAVWRLTRASTRSQIVLASYKFPLTILWLSWKLLFSLSQTALKNKASKT
jgi:hypothetical protein